MPAVRASDKVWDGIGNDIIFLRYRIGLSYERQGDGPRAPKSVTGALRFPAPPGAKFEKLYLPPLENGVRLGKKIADSFCGSAEYYRDTALHAAPYGELLLNDRPGSKVTFGRFGEEKPFSFSPEEDKHLIALVTQLAKSTSFNPLYMRVDIADRPTEYFVLDIHWGEDAVTVTLLPMKPEAEDCPELPEFLVV